MGTRAKHDRSESLAHKLLDCGRMELDRDSRNQAAEDVLDYLRRHGRRAFDTALGRHASHDELEAAQQKVLLAVVRGGFRGGTDTQAAAWLAAVLGNAARKDARTLRRHPTAALRDDAPSALASIGDAAEVREVVQALVSAVGDEIRRRARRRDARSLLKDWDLAASSALGETTAHQVARLGRRWLLPARPVPRQRGIDEHRAAAARIRQRRQRGRRSALLAVERLRSEGSWDSDWDAALEILGLARRAYSPQ